MILSALFALRLLPPDTVVYATAAVDGAPPGITGPLSTYGPVTLLGAFVLALLRGWLVPKSAVDKIEQRAERWETVALEAMRQNGRLIPTAEVAVDVLRQIPAAAPVAGEPAI